MMITDYDPIAWVDACATLSRDAHILAGVLARMATPNGRLVASQSAIRSAARDVLRAENAQRALREMRGAKHVVTLTPSVDGRPAELMLNIPCSGARHGQR